jgi:hypothetical protein
LTEGVFRNFLKGFGQTLVFWHPLKFASFLSNTLYTGWRRRLKVHSLGL